MTALLALAGAAAVTLALAWHDPDGSPMRLVAGLLVAMLVVLGGTAAPSIARAVTR